MEIISYPNLLNRPYSLQIEREMGVSIDVLYEAWTKGFGRWFAAPDSVIMEAKVNSVFFFETEFNGMRHPHYGRFLKLEDNRLVEITWITAGTKAETIVTVEFVSKDNSVMIKLTHAGFPDELSRNQHEEAWPNVLEQLDKQLKETEM